MMMLTNSCRYLKTVRPLLSDEEYKETEAVSVCKCMEEREKERERGERREIERERERERKGNERLSKEGIAC